MSASTRKRRLEAMQRRLDYVLNVQVPKERGHKSNALAYLLAEADALKWAIGELTQKEGA